jgi:hypothetical protein
MMGVRLRVVVRVVIKFEVGWFYFQNTGCREGVGTDVAPSWIACGRFLFAPLT